MPDSKTAEDRMETALRWIVGGLAGVGVTVMAAFGLFLLSVGPEWAGSLSGFAGGTMFGYMTRAR